MQDSRVGAHKVRTYFNKRFCKMTVRENYRSSQDIVNPMTDGPKDGVSIFGFEGFMLPSKVETDLAKRSGFDFYVITNLACLDIAYRLNFIPNVYVIGKQSIGNMDEIPITDDVYDLVQSGNPSFVEVEPAQEMEYEIEHFSKIDIKHSPEDLDRGFAEMQKLFPDCEVHDCLSLEEEMFRIFLANKGSCEIEKSVKVNLLDYGRDKKHTFICLVRNGEQKMFVISNITNY